MLPVVFKRRTFFALFLKNTTAMRAILFLLMFAIPMMSVGQLHKCPVDSRIQSGPDQLKYQLFQSVLEQRLSNQKIEFRSLQYFQVVIHVVSRSSVNPISEAQVRNQLDVLNADFAGRGENLGKLLPEFAPLVGNGNLIFCLATTDPDGNPTSGITFTHTDIVNIALQTGQDGRIAIHYDQLGGKTGWDPSRYINVWVGEYGDILGSASFPGAAPFPEEIGLVIGNKYFGSIGEAGNSGYFGRGHTFTHEMGHFFGLRHIWGNGFDANCEDSDDISDTPNAAGPYFGCPAGQQVSCNSSDMYQNFMDFSDDRCLAAFTQEQVTFMITAIDVYYPNLALKGDCSMYTDAVNDWYGQLKWSHDAAANTYVIYSAEILDQSVNVQVFSTDGRLAYDALWSDAQSHLLNLRGLASGVYFVRLTIGEDPYVRAIVLY
jgi:hypothetical protein